MFCLFLSHKNFIEQEIWKEKKLPALHKTTSIVSFLWRYATVRRTGTDIDGDVWNESYESELGEVVLTVVLFQQYCKTWSSNTTVFRHLFKISKSEY